MCQYGAFLYFSSSLKPKTKMNFITKHRVIMDNNNFCFVIQPIRDEKYTKRYMDIYEPAIINAGLNAYRVDLDPSAKNIIEEIEKRISESIICFADISEDNPNVWYELGFAYAIGKDVVMVCDETRKVFPFDISHKSIIPYKTESPSDFDVLCKKITEKINSYRATSKVSKKIIESPLTTTDGFQSYEKALLALIIGEQITDEQNVAVYLLTERMNKAGFNEIATSIGIRLLKRKDLLETYIDQDWNGNEYNACRLTKKGVDFILDNLQMFNLEQNTPVVQNPVTDDFPF